MIPCSDKFISALKQPSKELYIKIELYDHEMNYIDSIEKQVSQNDAGSVSVDKSRPIRRNFSFSIFNKDGKFSWGENNLIWISKKCKVWIGLKLSDGTIEYIPQGIFILTEPQDEHTLNSNKVSISGQDKAYLFTNERGKLVNELTIAKGVNIATAIKSIAQAGGETLFLFDNIIETVPYELNYSGNTSRWQVMDELAKLAKCEVYYDVNGYLRLRKVDDINQLQNDSPVWSFTIGDQFYAGNVRKMDESQLYNHFVTIGGGSQTATVRHEIVVTETDPLWVDCPYSIEQIGRITYFHNDGNPDSLIDTVESAKFRNKYNLMRFLGYVERVSLSIAPHFLLDCGDIIQIEDEENSVTGRYLIEKIDIPLSPQLTTLECNKERRIISDWNFI